MSAQLFEIFRKNLVVKDAELISISYKNITKCLNKHLHDYESDNANCRQIGSYGRQSAIHGVSDLDMAFILPQSFYSTYNSYSHNGQSKLLQKIKQVLLLRYPSTNIIADGQVVVIPFNKYRVEVLPVFIQNDGSYTYPDSNSGGSWKVTNPIAEIKAFNDLNNQTNRNLKHLCKMIRAWKNTHGVNISGFLIDTLCYKFFQTTTDYNTVSYSQYKFLIKDFFFFLISQSETQTFWFAPGSNQKVYKSGNFHAKAKKALRRSTEALSNSLEAPYKWKLIFGHRFPVEFKEAQLSYTFARTEQFIEDLYPVDIQNELTINCRIENISNLLRSLIYASSPGDKFTIPKQRKLTFMIESTDVVNPYKILWKVRNIGTTAERLNKIRGQIEETNKNIKTETTEFEGSHLVECYLIKNNICVARDRITVPI
ncbi:MAG: nucleotidyltransferase [Burkholderiales bacterium]|nr:nucleotidyltransferase [Burkholderiales bacterium]MBX9889743.1 nucleotidyltransferase [Amoebophilaceae bacterium]